MDSDLLTGPQRRPSRADTPRTWPSWLRIFLSGLVLWVATVAVTFATQNAGLVPIIILLGSFLIPVTFVSYAFGRTHGVLTGQRLFNAFVTGGVLGVLGASILEAALLHQPSTLSYLGVGLIEEAVKLAAVWLLARRLPRYAVRDGIVLGAAVGFGFAALESAGYAFNALFTTSGPPLVNLVETEVLRGVLAPVGHGLWTAILGGALFAVAARRERLRLSGSVLGWYGVVALLHALWDAAPAVSGWLTLLFTGTGRQLLLIEAGRNPAFSQAQLHLATTLSWVLMALDAVIGVLILRQRWCKSRAVTPATPATPQMDAPERNER